MKPRPADGVSLPARPTARDLAELLEVDRAEVDRSLRSLGVSDSSDDFLEPETALAVARAHGVPAVIEARDQALEALYEFETRGEVETELDGRARALADAVIAGRDQLDQMIEDASEHWSVARMPVIDRNVLRLGLHELQNEPETPTAVIISEAVRLAQTYSTERSGSFVNGVLATLASAVRT